MAKKKVALKNLGKQHVKDALLRAHPFLRNEYRTLKKEEKGSDKVFRELFGDDVPLELYKLSAIYEFQK